MAIYKGIVKCLQFNNITRSINQFKIVRTNYVISLSMKLNYIPCFDQHLLMNITLFIVLCTPDTRGRAPTKYMKKATWEAAYESHAHVQNSVIAICFNNWTIYVRHHWHLEPDGTYKNDYFFQHSCSPSFTFAAWSNLSRIVFSSVTPCRSSSCCCTSISSSSLFTSFIGIAFICLRCGTGRGGAGPFFLFHWP